MRKHLSCLLLTLMALGCTGPREDAGRVALPGVNRGQRERVDIRTIFIPTVRNDTREYGIEDYLSNRIIQQFIADGRLYVGTADQAQLVLRTRIYRYVKEPTVYNDQDEVLQYNVGIWVETALHETGSDTPLWRDRDIYSKSTYSERLAPIETEVEVQQRLADDIAALVANRVLEGWSRYSR
jgi:hypothetical protein